jgi:hypothetical protein
MSAQAGQRVELQRYRITSGERALIAQRIDGRVAVVDVPLDHEDRVYLVERHVTSQAELAGICAAYAEHSEHTDRPAVIAQRDLFDRLADPSV